MLLGAGAAMLYSILYLSEFLSYFTGKHSEIFTLTLMLTENVHWE